MRSQLAGRKAVEVTRGRRLPGVQGKKGGLGSVPQSAVVAHKSKGVKRSAREDPVHALKTMLVRRVFLAVLLAICSFPIVGPRAAMAGTIFVPPDPNLCKYVTDHGKRITTEVPDVEWICQCKELRNGNIITIQCRWELGAKRGGSTSRQYAYSSSTYGCLLAVNVLVSDYYGASTNLGAGEAVDENYPCDGLSLKTQPAGEIRDQAVLEYYSGGAWHRCTPLGYRYNPSASWLVTNAFNMGLVPDCPAATYRLSNTVGAYDGGAWRGGTQWAPELWMQ